MKKYIIWLFIVISTSSFAQQTRKQILTSADSIYSQFKEINNESLLKIILSSNNFCRHFLKELHPNLFAGHSEVLNTIENLNSIEFCKRHEIAQVDVNVNKIEYSYFVDQSGRLAKVEGKKFKKVFSYNENGKLNNTKYFFLHRKKGWQEQENIDYYYTDANLDSIVRGKSKIIFSYNDSRLENVEFLAYFPLNKKIIKTDSLHVSYGDIFEISYYVNPNAEEGNLNFLQMKYQLVYNDGGLKSLYFSNAKNLNYKTDIRLEYDGSNTSNLLEYSLKNYQRNNLRDDFAIKDSVFMSYNNAGFLTEFIKYRDTGDYHYLSSKKMNTYKDDSILMKSEISNENLISLIAGPITVTNIVEYFFDNGKCMGSTIKTKKEKV